MPVGVLVSPLIPGLNDHEIPRLAEAAAKAGARFAGSALLRLPHAVAPLFEQWLTSHFPERAEKVLGRIRAMRGGKLNDARFGVRFSGEGVLARQMEDLFDVACRRAGLDQPAPHLSTASFRRPPGPQLELGL